MKKIILALIALVFSASCAKPESREPRMLERIWSFTEFEQPISNGVRIADGKVMAASISGMEYALLDESDGYPNWHHFIEGEAGNDNTFAPIKAEWKMIFSAGNLLRCFDISTGDELWSVGISKTDIGPQSFAEPAYSNGRIFVGTSSGSLLCIDAPSGIQNWEIKSNEDGFGPVVAIGNKIVVNMLSGRIECRKQDQGWVVWKNDHFRLPLESIPHAGDMLILSNPGPSLAALGINEMKVFWEYSFRQKSGTLDFNPEIDGKNILCCDENRIYTINLDDGKLLKSFEIPFDPKTFTVFSGKVYLSSKNILYCYDYDGNQLAQFKEPEGDDILGTSIGEARVVCWSARAIHGLLK